MPSGHEELSRQLAQLLQRRPGWRLQVTATPGTPAVWCFGTGSEIELSVSAEEASLCVYEVQEDQEVRVPGVPELVAWLNAHWEGSLKEPRISLADKLKRGSLFRW